MAKAFFDAGGTERDRVRLRQTLTVRVAGLGDLYEHARCLEARDGRSRSVVLFLNDRAFPGVTAWPQTDPAAGELRFSLRREIDAGEEQESAREAWIAVLGKPRFRARTMRVSVGLDDQVPLPSDATVDFLALPRGWLAFWGVAFVGLLIVFFLLATRSNVLRDPGEEPGGDARRPYSLSRLQAAVWFFLVLACYLLIGMVTGDYSSSITGTVVALLAISGGTSIASAFVDKGKEAQLDAPLAAATAQAVQLKLSSARAKLADLAQETADLPKAGSAADVQAKVAEGRALTRQVKAHESQLAKIQHRSEGWLLDILSDANGVSFHRFQIAAWTLVLAVVFAAHVYRDLAMPQFSETLLALMGISSGTYLGLKVPEPTVPNQGP
ncbi:MAG: hypothetical protein AAF481_20080 [Acidobacteriota bacterium]